MMKKKTIAKKKKTETRGRTKIEVDEDSLLIEIVLWRRSYLEKLRKFRNSDRKIYYLDETWVNEGHAMTKVWQDCNIQTRRQAFLKGFSPGLKTPSERGRRLIITHIGISEYSQEFRNAKNRTVFESQRTGDCHEDMHSGVSETWFSFILSFTQPGAVVMNNAPYHSRRTEKLPTSTRRK
ncbi:hypothetical protein NQ317_017275 [Molorchus minor]|uniref:Transposase n=1 Tax=Molorchus minor TaxID=1323400 RepID=A0ABQ9JU04_9CUCU|nr:hypothetical protein NQ317_017275 [Molorchus minor]